ncbi:MAG: UMP kinase [Pseudomonadota bacterium]|jgi:uridylate kinase|nr:UMP kinase [Gammaproteobacteria bacterium]MEC8421608.1 UMP kinase [Pseudomonadota bacterium]MEC9190676.1 UMP kinase [Pseudomonadota bacterium]|tara:strand:- start:449 stop:1150 length:702 start_codon:yes stop_codon:yes gene_type:complete
MSRYLLKLSGEALIGQYDHGIDHKVLNNISSDIVSVVNKGHELAIVVGGGNIFRGARLAQTGIDRVTGDNIGMLSTIINSLAIQDSIEKNGVECRVMSAVRINQIAEDYIRRRAIRHLEKGRIIIFAAGTGNPFFTTDTAASLRAIEINADMMLKATKVDGVFDKDPKIFNDAKIFKTITYSEVIQKELKVMDTTAMVLCKENSIPLRIFNVTMKNSISKVIVDESIGTKVTT